MRIFCLVVLVLLCMAGFGQDSVHDFVIFSDGNAVPIVVDPNDQNTVLLAASLFADDIERVTGVKPLTNPLPDQVRDDISPVTSHQSPITSHQSPIIIGCIESSELIKELIRTNKIDVSDIIGQWEACITEVIDNPFPGVDQALVIAGSDRRGTAYGVFELSKQIGVSPWYWFADVPVRKKEEIKIKKGKYMLKSPSVKYRGVFINDEMWGLRPWAMNTHAPDEGKGIGPTTYARIFELLLRLKANLVWPAMHQETKPFNYYPENKVVADEYGIVMGSSHIEPMLRNNIGNAEWDTEYPGLDWDYVKNREQIYEYWENRVKENGRYENMYTLGKRGKDDYAGSDITVKVLEGIFADQREILAKWVNPDVTKVPQVLIPYTEVLNLYNEGLQVPDDVIICWPDDNFGNIRQLPNEAERKRSGGSGVYYHFQWLNGATTAYTWTCTTPLALTWFEMKKAYDFGADKLWVVNVGDIKPAEINIEYFMQLAWDIDSWDHRTTPDFVRQWATREFGHSHASEISAILDEHYELGYARRPESLVMWNGREQKLSWEWFSLDQYGDEGQRRIDQYADLITRVDRVYEQLPDCMKDAFFQTVVYNIKGTALQNLKVLNAQKSHRYGQQKRASAAGYAARAQDAEDQIYALIDQYNRGLIDHGDKWDHMASLPGPWGGQWHQWDMPPLSSYSGDGSASLNYAVEGGDSLSLPRFSVAGNDSAFIDLYNSGNGIIYWTSTTSDDWIRLSESKGSLSDETRIWVSVDFQKAPKNQDFDGKIHFSWSASQNQAGPDWDQGFDLSLSVFNPDLSGVSGFIESNGVISIEAEHFTRKTDRQSSWEVLDGLGRSGNSITILPVKTPPIISGERILTESPAVEYDLHLFSSGAINITLNCSPGLPVNGDYRQRVAVALDDQEPQIIDYERGNRDVMNNLMTLHGTLTVDSPGAHILKVFMVDPGVVIDKITLFKDQLPQSYLGPPESVCFKQGVDLTAIPEVNDRVHIFYYAWFGNPETDGGYAHWNHPILPHGPDPRYLNAGSYPGGAAIGANFYPMLGCYSSNDRQTVDQHMRWISEAGAGVVAISWWGQNQREEASMPMYFDLAQQYGLKIAFHIEPVYKSVEEFRDLITYLQHKYGSHPALYRYDDKPLYYVYESHKLKSKEWRQLLSADGSESIRNTELDATFIGLWVLRTSGNFFLESGFDGFYTYFASDGFVYGSTPANWKEMAAFAQKNDLIFIPCAGPGYLDTRIRPWNAGNTEDRKGGEYYRYMLNSAIDVHPEFIGVTSFNEWHEGTQIEPAIPYRIGDYHYEDYGQGVDPKFYLQLTRELLMPFVISY